MKVVVGRWSLFGVGRYSGYIHFNAFVTRVILKPNITIKWYHDNVKIAIYVAQGKLLENDMQIIFFILRDHVTVVEPLAESYQITVMFCL